MFWFRTQQKQCLLIVILFDIGSDNIVQSMYQFAIARDDIIIISFSHEFKDRDLTLREADKSYIGEISNLLLIESI